VSAKRLGVWLHDELVAELRSSRPGRISCRYTRATVERYATNAPLLSCSLPLRRTPQDAWAFSTGLLPEGQHRQSMAALAGLPTSDVMGLLERFGRDVAGAVIISADDPPVREPSIQPYQQGDLAEEISTLDRHPLGIHDDSELSIAGLQDKILLVRTPDGGWGRPRNGYPSTHILKIDDRVHHGLVRAEHACLQIAALAGIRAADSELVRVGDAECIVVERFDRQRSGDKVLRIHQEDACQALGINPESNRRLAKYENYGGPGLKAVAGVLTRWSADRDGQLRELLRQATFTVLIGNADAHGKNLAFIHVAPESIELAPLYDTVPTMIWPSLRTDAAMHIGGRRDLAAVTLDDLVAEATSWGVSTSTARAVIATVADGIREVLQAGSVDVDTPALEAVAGRAARFLEAT